MCYSNFKDPEKVRAIDKLVNKLTDIRNKDIRFKDRAFNNKVDNMFKQLQMELNKEKQKEYV